MTYVDPTIDFSRIDLCLQVPDCTIYVNHTDGETLQYGNPANTAQTNMQIMDIRQHLFAMKGQNVSTYLPAVACPGYEAEYTYW